MEILTEFKIIQESTPLCEWDTFTESEGIICPNKGTNAIQHLLDFPPDVGYQYECIAHLCDTHIQRGLEISKEG